MNEPWLSVKPPAGVVAEFKRILKEAPDDVLVGYAGDHPLLLRGGFKPNAKNAAHFRSMIAAEIDRHPELNEELAGLLAPSCDILSNYLLLISQDFFCDPYSFAYWAAYFGRDVMLAAMMLHPDRVVVEVAQDLVDFVPDPSLPPITREDAALWLRDLVAPLTGGFVEWSRLVHPDIAALESGAPVPGLSPAAPGPQPAAEGEAAPQRLSILRREIERLRESLQGMEKRLAEETDIHRAAREKIEARVRERDAEIAALKEQLAAERRRCEQGEAALQAERARQADLDRRMADLVGTEVEERLRGALRDWLGRAAAVEAARGPEADARARDLLDRAEDALRRQAELDRHTGNRTAVGERLRHLEQLRARIGTARAEALHAWGPLKDIGDEVEAEIRRLRGLLGQEPDAASLERFLRDGFARAGESDEALARMHDLLDLSREAGLLPDDAFRRLAGLHRDRVSRLYDEYAPGPRVVEPSTANPVAFLAFCLHRNRTSAWLLDGYNIAFLLPEHFGDATRSPEATRAARIELTRRVLALFSQAPCCHARIYYDGAEARSTARSAGVTEIFSGGEGEHRADQVMLRDLPDVIHRHQGAPVFIVSSDRDLRNSARAAGAHPMSAQAFSVFLHPAAAPAVEPAPPPAL